MSKGYWTISILFLALVLSVATLGAQNVGTISGTVSDETGAVLPGSTIEVVNLDTGATRVVATSGAGACCKGSSWLITA